MQLDAPNEPIPVDFSTARFPSAGPAGSRTYFTPTLPSRTILSEAPPTKRR